MNQSSPTEICLTDANERHFLFNEPLNRLSGAPGSSVDWSGLEAAVNLATKKQLWTVVYISYEAANCCVGMQPMDSYGLPPWIFWQFKEAEQRPSTQRFPLCDWHGLPAEKQYQQNFNRTMDLIDSGTLYQLNLTYRAFCDQPSSWVPFANFDDAPNAVSCIDPQLSLWSTSPECFLHGSLAKKQIVTKPIKGTSVKTESSDALIGNAKETAEHVMIVDMARNDLGRISQPGSIKVDPLLMPLTLPYAYHLESTVSATLKTKSIAKTLQACLPAASITGTPKVEACRQIRAIETTPRGPYTGIIGWISPEQEFHFSLLIRTIWQDSNGRYCYGTGGGLVHDSQISSEYAELLLKLKGATPARSVS